MSTTAAGVDTDTPDAGYRRASFCAANGCVEVAMTGDRIMVRDSKLRDSPVLTFDAQEWTAFVRGVKAGEFDGPWAEAERPVELVAG